MEKTLGVAFLAIMSNFTTAGLLFKEMISLGR
jgi:hypothetical protein